MSGTTTDGTGCSARRDMLVIIQAFLNIALRRKGPEDLPDSTFLLLATALVYVLMQGLVGWPIYDDSGLLLRLIVVDFLLLYAFVRALLLFTGKDSRHGRTLSALFGTGALLAAFAIPFNIWLDLTMHDEGEAVAMIPVLGILAILVWSVIINGHILSRALSSPFAVGLLIALGYFFFNYMMLIQIRGPEI